MAGFGWLVGAKKVLGATLCGSSIAAPTTVYVCLLTSITSHGDSRTEVTTNIGYARQPVTFQPPGNTGSIISSITATFGSATSPWGTVTYASLIDTLTIGQGGTWYWGTLDTARTVQTSDSLSFSAGQITVQLD